MANPAPITLTQVDTEDYDSIYAPKPFVVVGDIPLTGIEPQTAPAAADVPFASLTAAANSFNALRTALIASGVLTA